MRLFLAALTIGAAGIGYVYSQQPAVPAAEHTAASRRPLYDWHSADETLKVATVDVSTTEEPPLVVRDTINTTRSEITSVLDEFVRTSGESKPAPLPSDIMSQVTPAANLMENDELVPFASSDTPAPTTPQQSDISTAATEPADATTTENRAANEPSGLTMGGSLGNVEGASPPVSMPAQAASKPAVAKPSISEATLVTKKQAGASKAGSQEGNQPIIARSKTELLPGNIPQKPIVDPEWTRIGSTNDGLPIHARHYGRQGTKTLVIAGLDGRDLVGTRWNDMLSETLMVQTDLLQVNDIFVVRSGNPDGLTRKQATNARGVLINRNFPVMGSQTSRDRFDGPTAISETETKAIVDSINTYQPRRVIHLTSTTGPSLVVYNRAGREIAEMLASQFRLNMESMENIRWTGSLEEYADGSLNAAVISLRLSRDNNWEQAWQRHLPVLLTAIHGGNPEQLVTVSDGPASKDDPLWFKKRRGYEELPPPPR